MDDDKTDAPKPGKSRKRAPPTIDLTAASVSDSVAPATTPEVVAAEREAMMGAADAATETVEASAATEAASDSAAAESAPAREPAKSGRGVFPILIAGVTGALAALLVLLALWFATGPGGMSSRIVSRLPQVTTKADMETLNSRVSKIETRPSTSAAAPAVDPALTARLDALEKSVASLRDDIASARSAVDAIKSAPREAAAAPDLSAIEDRIAKVERATVALTSEVAAPAKPAEEDPRLRLVAVATSLDASVRQSEPYAATLATAKSLAGDNSTFKPLEAFADKGVPSAGALNKELLALLPQLTSRPVTTATPSNLMERLQQSASKLVRVERVDNAAAETAAVVARAKAAAERDDLAAARREVMALAPTARAPLQAWTEKVAARDAALAASKQFASDMTAALAKPAR